MEGLLGYSDSDKDGSGSESDSSSDSEPPTLSRRARKNESWIRAWHCRKLVLLFTIFVQKTVKGPIAGEPAKSLILVSTNETNFLKREFVFKYFFKQTKNLGVVHFKRKLWSKTGPITTFSRWVWEMHGFEARSRPFPSILRARHAGRKVDFRPKRGSGSGLGLSVGAQTLRTCGTHQLSRFWKSERKTFTLGEEISIFRFWENSVFGSSREVWFWAKIEKPKFLHPEWIFFAQILRTCPAGV